MSLKFSSSYKAIQICLLDGTNLARSIYKHSKVIELVDNLLQMFNVVEKDYFGLYYTFDRRRQWLKPKQKIWPQIRQLDPPYQLHFGMHFYPRDPVLLQEEITTYLMYLQLRKDIIEDRIVSTENERAEMCAYILQAEGSVSSSESYIKKHRMFFVHLQRSSPELETQILQVLDSLSGMNGIAAEAKLIDCALYTAQYDIEPYQVRSDAHPSLKDLSLAIGPIGVTIYRDKMRFEIFGWTEIWNAGYNSRCFWFKIFRDGEHSKHKYSLISSKHCKAMWKLFKECFKFYTEDHSIQPKVAWGRVAPTVDRSNLFQPSSIANQSLANMNNPLALATNIDEGLSVQDDNL